MNRAVTAEGAGRRVRVLEQNKGAAAFCDSEATNQRAQAIFSPVSVSQSTDTSSVCLHLNARQRQRHS